MDMSRIEMQQILARFCAEDPAYREALIAHPKEVVQEQFQMQLPADLQVKVAVEDPKTIYVVVPHVIEQGAELSDDDLETVAGGQKVKGDANCSEAVLSTAVQIEASLF